VNRASWELAVARFARILNDGDPAAMLDLPQSGGPVPAPGSAEQHASDATAIGLRRRLEQHVDTRAKPLLLGTLLEMENAIAKHQVVIWWSKVHMPGDKVLAVPRGVQRQRAVPSQNCRQGVARVGRRAPMNGDEEGTAVFS